MMQKQQTIFLSMADLQSGQLTVQLVDDAQPRTSPLLTDFLEMLCQKKMASGRLSAASILHATVRQLLAFTHGHPPLLHDVDEDFLRGYAHFLATRACTRQGGRLSPTSANAYFAQLRAALTLAVKRRLISRHPALALLPDDVPHAMPQSRQFLTPSELHRLEEAPCAHAEVKRAFLFACHTGLRISDIRRLRWHHIHLRCGAEQIEMWQQKTRQELTVPLFPAARRWMPLPAAADQPVFSLPSSLSYIDGRVLPQWAARSRVDKHVTFHTARHTFATLMLSSGADIYTTSRLLGHRSLRTTQIYAQVVDEKKRNAVAMMQRYLDAHP